MALLYGSMPAVADRIGMVGLAEQVGASQEEEEMGVEADDDDEHDSSWDELEDGGKVEGCGESTVSSPKAKASEAPGNGVNDQGNEPKDGPEPSDPLLHR